MILLDVKADSAKAALSQLLLGTKSPKNDTFGKMLQELSAQVMAEEGTEPNALLQLLQKGEPDKKNMPDGVLKLLTPSEAEGSVSTADENVQHIINPKFASLPKKEMLPLIQQAKTFLKTQISDIAEVKELPKTLAGLVRLAEKVGIDLSKITLEQINPEAKETKQSTLPFFQKQKTDIGTEQLVQTKQNQGDKTKAEKGVNEPLRSLLHTPVQENKTEPLNTKHLESAPAAKPDNRSSAPAMAANTQQHKDNSPTSQLQPKAETAPAVAKPAENTPLQAKPEQGLEPLKQANVATTATEVIKDSKKGPKRAELSSSTAAPNTTAQEPVLPEHGQSKPAVGAQPAAVSNALHQLLHGTQEVAVESSQGESVTESKPLNESKAQQTLSNITKPEIIEQKMVEAKQMVRHFAGEVREAIENYKPPFTRIKIKLNPVKLGEVDVTMVQRGNNVHINISSNTTAITTLAQHANELKTQLAQNGVNNTTMNFSSGSEQQQRQQQHHQQHAAELYEAYEQYDENPTLYSQLELIVPRYI